MRRNELVDRRQHQRARDPDLTATLMVGHQHTTCHVRDVSGGGAKCVVPRGFVAGAGGHVELALVHPRAARPIAVVARVMRVEQIDEDSDLVAVQFIAIPDPVEATIVQIVLRSLERVRTAAETVLVVDDEESIRVALTREMKRLNRRALVVASADEAVRAVQDDANGISVAMVDLGLGADDGMDVVAYLAVEYPHLRRVVMSGQRFDDLESAVATGTAHALLRKPWTKPTLESAIRL